MEPANRQLLPDSGRELPASRRRLTALLAATRAVADAPGLAEAARRVLAVLGEAEGWSAGIVWLLADGDDRLRRADAWAIEQGSGRGRASATGPTAEGAPESAPRSSGAPREAIVAGRAWALGRAVFVGDLTRDDELRREGHLEREGFRAAAAIPLPLGGDAGIAGVLELLGRTPREPDAFAEELWSVIAVELGQLARRVAVVHALADADERLRTVLTERWQAEAALRRSEAQLIEADRLASLGTLAAGVAHEINNPLSYVLLNLDLVIREAKGEGESVPRLREARAGVERVRLIVQDLKSFSRGNTDRKVPVDVRRVLDSTLEIAANEIRHRAELVRDFRDVPPVLADASRLGQVFLNLLVNAAQAMIEGDASRQELRVATSTDAAGRAVIEIADTGAGIAPENLERIFDPFFTTKPVGVGTGLGLSICRTIVTALGGDITVESERGRGTTFRVVLPAASSPVIADEPTPPPASAPSAPGGPRDRGPAPSAGSPIPPCAVAAACWSSTTSPRSARRSPAPSSATTRWW